ncbi:hypothetical protein H7J88_03205 [Mycolicibacterium flavescens]|uniref:Uncharacterized protein n=1 Tax=Mycolicibacterium flavescens TaxID=1776 RepID=A0A1E3RBV3_MYCFV|nr:hypothetical protein [Mycolicibacterium flavescens]MCV7278656.1 hypothetical protein [Mycolicibacterium flavescens]ODQ87299.1 hypothetical protein BHQ18_24315 [Mycolicibacterium flavescens]
MRLTAAFFANRSEVVDNMLNVEGAFWASTTVAPESTAFRCDVVVLCDTEPDDVGAEFTLVIDSEGPSGPLAPISQAFTLAGESMFICMPATVLPVEPGGGYHRYRFRLDGQHEFVDVRLAVRLSFT